FVLLAVITPVVIFLLLGVLKAGATVRRSLEDIAVVGGTMVADLEPVPQLVTTVGLVDETTAGLARYGTALDGIL
ncbi:MAG: hypothetical protein M3417_10555, partial [Actinomycetota bacterium]|nr:hypothetical protein [Actinomycetota bacterium]